MLPESIQLIVQDDKGPLDQNELIMGESIKALEFAIYSELNACIVKAEREGIPLDKELSRNIAELQCALDIVQNTKSTEETQKVYEILKYFRDL